MCQTMNAAKSKSATAAKAKETAGAKHNKEEYQILGQAETEQCGRLKIQYLENWGI